MGPFGVELISKAKSRVARELFAAGRLPANPVKRHYVKPREREGQVLAAHYEGRANAKAVARGEKKPEDVNQRRYSYESMNDRWNYDKDLPNHPNKAFGRQGKLGASDGSRSKMLEIRRERIRYVKRNYPEFVVPHPPRVSGRKVARGKK